MKRNIFKLITILSTVFIPLFTNASFIGTSPTVVSTSTCSTGLSCGLVGYWTFDGKDMVNGVALDKSGNNNRGNFVNIATSTSFNPGKIGQGLNFDGSSNYVNVGNSTVLAPTTAVTISAWVKPLKKANSIHYSAIASRNTTNYLVMIRQDGIVVFYLAGVQNWVTNDGTKNLFDGHWHLVTATYDGSFQRLYVDAILMNSSPITGNITSNSNATLIGRDTTSATNFNFSGSLDDVRIYNRALSASEISQLYSSGASTKQGSSPKVTATSTCSVGLSCGLVGYWTFDGKDVVNGVALDKSGNGNTGRLLNIATSTFFSSGKLGQGFNFDGSNDTVNAGSATVIDNMSAMTISMWVKLNTYGASGGGYLINKGDTSSGGHGWSMYLTQANGLVTFTARYNTTSLLSQSASNTFAPSDIGKWVHLIVTWDGTTNSATGVHIYKNGTEVSYSSQINGSASYLSDAANDLNIGDGGIISNRQTNGIIDDVRLYNRVLSSKEISQLYSSGANTKQGSSQVITATSTCSVGLSCGLVGYWTFDGKDVVNGVALDKSGNNNRGNLVNISTSTFYAPGKIGQGFNFDGSNDYVELGTANSLHITGDMTISAWIKTPTIAQGQLGIAGNFNSGGTQTPWLFEINRTAGKVNFIHLGGADDTGNFTATGNTTISVNKWIHVVAVRTGSSGVYPITFYYNGVADGTTNIDRDPGSNQTSRIGRAGALNGEIFNGSIDDVRIYNRALSASEIRQLYNMGK